MAFQQLQPAQLQQLLRLFRTGDGADDQQQQLVAVSRLASYDDANYALEVSHAAGGGTGVQR